MTGEHMKIYIHLNVAEALAGRACPAAQSKPSWLSIHSLFASKPRDSIKKGKQRVVVIKS